VTAGHPFFVSTPEQMYAVTQGLLKSPAQAEALHKPKLQLPRIVSAVDLVMENMDLPAQLIEGVLHKGLKGVLASSSKAGKTWMLMDMALSVASGKDWLKWKTNKAKVLVVNFEIPDAFVAERIRQLTPKKGGIDEGELANVHILNLRGHSADFSDLLKSISHQIASEAYGLIILDPIYKGLAGADENKAGDIAQLCHQLEMLCVQTGAAVVYAHHFSKGNKSSQNPLDRLSGSGVFARDPDSIILLTAHEVENCYTVDLILRNLPQVEPFVVEWEFPLMKLREDLSAEKLAGRGGRPKIDVSDELLELIADKPMTTTEWEEAAVEELKISASTFDRQKKQLVEGKQVSRNEETGKWHVSERPAEENNPPAEE
jgi:hypothetical protein